MALNTGVALIDEISAFGIKDLLTYQAARNQLKIDAGMADTSNYVARLNAQAALMNGQVLASNSTGNATPTGLTSNTWLLIGAAAVVVGVVFMIKK